MALMITSFIQKDSFIQELNPISKIFLILLVITSIIILDNLYITYFFLINVFFLAYLAKIEKEFVKGITIVMLPIAVWFLIIHGIVNPAGKTILFKIWFIPFRKEGLLFALNFGSKLVTIISYFYFFIITTYPGDIVGSFSKIGLPYKAGFLINSSLQMLPLMQRRAEKILEAQEARGLKVKGKLKDRFKAYTPLIIPLILGALMEAYERVLAIEIRGFSAKVKKTHYREVNFEKKDLIFCFTYLFLTLILIIGGGNF